MSKIRGGEQTNVHGGFGDGMQGVVQMRYPYHVGWGLGPPKGPGSF